MSVNNTNKHKRVYEKKIMYRENKTTIDNKMKYYGLSPSISLIFSSKSAFQLFFQEVFHVSTMVYAINGISSTYVEISEKYLIDNINSLPRLIALNPKKSAISTKFSV
jgi:hypothetical protein